MNKTNIRIRSGAVHGLPADVRQTLIAVEPALITWNSITPLARNEWICWVISVKKAETRERRLRILKENLKTGKRRPCCFAGCPHRIKQL